MLTRFWIFSVLPVWEMDRKSKCSNALQLFQSLSVKRKELILCTAQCVIHTTLQKTFLWSAHLLLISVQHSVYILSWYLYSTRCSCTQSNGAVVRGGIRGDNPLDWRINTLDLLNTIVCCTIIHHFDWTSLQHCYRAHDIFVRVQWRDQFIHFSVHFKSVCSVWWNPQNKLPYGFWVTTGLNQINLNTVFNSAVFEGMLRISDI